MLISVSVAKAPSSSWDLRLGESIDLHWRMILVLLLSLQTTLLVWSARVHTPTWDEPAHLVAGLSHWKYGRFDLYSVNPPLVRVLASAPVYFGMDLDVDWSLYSRNSALRSEVPLGRAFMENNKDRALDAIFVARIMLFPVALLGSILCFSFTKELLDSTRAGLVAAFLWAFSPDVLAYGSVITPDLASAVVALGCSYALWHFLMAPTWNSSLALGIATGIAMLVKSIWLILPAVYAGVWILLYLYSRGVENKRIEPIVAPRSWVRLGVACGLALLLVNVFYGFQGTGRNLGSFDFVSQFGSGNSVMQISEDQRAKLIPIAFLQSPLTGKTDSLTSISKSLGATKVQSAPACESCGSGLQDAGCACSDCPDCEASTAAAQSIALPEIGNRFRKTVLGYFAIPLPASYLEGIDVQRRDFESGLIRPEWASYFAGKWKSGGWWYFYLVGLLFKTPFPLLVLLVIATASCFVLKYDQRQWLGWMCIAAPAIAVLFVISINTGLNRYLRYALPVLPFLIIWGASATRLGRQRPRLSAVVLGMCLAVYGWASISSGPHWLGYFNQLAGGSERAHYWFADSNVDWGQDLGLVRDWIKNHPEVKSNVHLAYFGSYGPSCLNIDYRVPPILRSLSSRMSESDSLEMGPLPGWYIVSKNYLIGHPMPIEDENGRLLFHRGAPFAYFHWFNPVDRIGQSTLVYHLTIDDVNPIRSKLGLPLIAPPATPLSLPNSTLLDPSFATIGDSPQSTIR